MNKILIVGYGIVGSAVASVFRKTEYIIIDPRQSRKRIEDFKGCKFKTIFVCVDTPKEDNFNLLKAVIKKINRLLPGNIVCCKSTALPLVYKRIKKENKNIFLIHSPEFLSHRTNIKDFKTQKFLIFGGEKKSCNYVGKLLKNRLKNVKKIIYTDIKTAAFVKYASNTFLASKITFFNELYRIGKKSRIGTSFDSFVKILTNDSRIGNSHTMVPGSDGQFGWGGHCFDKDFWHLYKFSNSGLLKSIIDTNKRHRNYHD